MKTFCFYFVVSSKHQDGIIVDLRDLFFYCNRLLTREERQGIQVVAIEPTMVELVANLKVPRFRRAS